MRPLYKFKSIEQLEEDCMDLGVRIPERSEGPEGLEIVKVIELHADPETFIEVQKALKDITSWTDSTSSLIMSHLLVYHFAGMIVTVNKFEVVDATESPN